MKIVFISDTHGKHDILTSKAYNNILGEGDILVHAGDCTNVGKTHEIKDFLDWFSNTPFTHKIFIAGNHDFGFEKNHDIAPEYKEKGVHYLFDSSVEIDGVKFYGSPWQPEFYDWAFNLPRRGPGIMSKWQDIPVDTDILITHGPPNKILDYVVRDAFYAGCEELLDRVMEIKPKVNVFGHIHQGYGSIRVNDIEFINASVLNEAYSYANLPVNVEYDEIMGIVKYY